MHPYVLISLASSVFAAGIAAAIAAREPDRRAHRLLAATLGCASYWGLCEVFLATSGSAEAALMWARWSSPGPLLLAPLALHLMLAVLPTLERRLWRLVGASYATTVVLVIAAVTTPGYVSHVVPTPWGWSPAPGAAVPLVYAASSVFPLAAFAEWLRAGRPGDRRRLPSALELAILLPLFVASITDFALPLYGVAVPRLGSTSVAAWGGLTFLLVYRYRDPTLAPHRFAREILETLPDGVAVTRVDGRIRATNRRLGALAGCDPGDLMGRPLDELVPGADAPELDRERRFELCTTSGERIPVAVTSASLRDQDGATIGRAVVVRDQRELVSLRSHLVIAGRLAAVGQLAAGIAHEINNPLAYVRSNLSLLGSHWTAVSTELEKTPERARASERLREGAELLRESGEGMQRVAEIVRDVGGFSGDGPAARELCDLRELLDAALRVAAPQLRGAWVERRYQDLPRVHCVAPEMMQVFLNLLLNAVQSLGGQGRVVVHAREEEGEAVVEVEDDGCGVPSELIDRIFEPFFTTKPAGEGTGLGLAISRKIVASHRGRIEVDSRPGVGSRFRVRLPATRAGEEP